MPGGEGRDSLGEDDGHIFKVLEVMPGPALSLDTLHATAYLVQPVKEPKADSGMGLQLGRREVGDRIDEGEELLVRVAEACEAEPIAQCCGGAHDRRDAVGGSQLSCVAPLNTACVSHQEDWSPYADQGGPYAAAERYPDCFRHDG